MQMIDHYISEICVYYIPELLSKLFKFWRTSMLEVCAIFSLFEFPTNHHEQVLRLQISNGKMPNIFTLARTGQRVLDYQVFNTTSLIRNRSSMMSQNPPLTQGIAAWMAITLSDKDDATMN